MPDLEDLVFRPCPLAHLPLISMVARRLGIHSAVDAALPRDGRNKVSDAECVDLMLLNILSGRVGLYHMGPWLAVTDWASVLGAGCDPDHFSDSRLAGTLDRIFDYGPDNLLTEVVVGYLRGDSAPSEYSVHQDTTTLTLHGEYERFYKPGEPRPAQGHNKDHRPDLKQLVYGLSVHSKMGIPLCVSTLDGNSSDQEANRLHLDRLAGLLPPEDEVTLVADCKLVDAETVGLLMDAAFHFVSLLPRTFNLRAQVVEQVSETVDELPELAREKGRSAADPKRVYRGSSMLAPFPVLNPESGEKRDKDMRFLAVESSQLARKFEEGLEKLLAKDRRRIETAMAKLSKLEFACEEDAQKAFWHFTKDPGLHTVDAECMREVITERRARPGRPKKR